VTRRAFLAGLVLLASSASAGATQKTTRKPRTHTVKIDGMIFTPASLTIDAGDTVTWVNNDIVAHTATAADGSFDSRMIAAGKSWKQTFTSKGDFAYVCKYHPTMKGTLKVRAASPGGRSRRG
jgi:plastocyanin